MPEVKNIPISAITPRPMGPSRKSDPASRRGLVDSITQIGLQTPITVLAVEAEGRAYAHDGKFYQLVVGENRLNAVMDLGWETIPAFVTDLDEINRQIWEIDENLIRAELTELERAEHFQRRKCLYLRKHPETAHVTERGGPGRGKTTAKSAAVLQVPSFVEDTSTKTGLSERTVQQAIRRAETIAPEVREQIRDIPEIADSGVELDALASLPAEEQVKAVEAVKTGKAKTVRAVITHEQKHACPTKSELWWSTMTGTWKKGTDADRERFHEWIHQQMEASA